MSGTAPQQGNENRSSILSTTTPSGIGFLGSPYSPADSLLTPPQIGVTSGDSIDSVLNAVKGVAFYTDMIGFGGSSNSVTAGMPLAPLGINYFLNTGQTCSNGASMYQYFQGIPTGDVLGSSVANAMQQMGMPALKGLAPGMLEDTEDALDPSPLLNAMLGSGYPQCRQVTLPVGDSYGHIADPTTGASWIDNPSSATQGSDGLYYQTNWVQDVDANGDPISLTKDQWTATPKAYNPDGTPASTTPPSTESFTNMLISSPGTSAVVIGILVLLAFGLFKKSV
jgi:hypothetical protein